MAEVRLFLWDLSVAVGIFGLGSTCLRLLKCKRPPLAVSGCFGVSLWIALGGYLNLLHLLRPGVFFTLVGVGVLCALLELSYARKHRSAPDPERTPQEPLSFTAKLLLAVAIVMIGTLMFGAMRPLLWCFDDLQGYIALGVKAAQTHSIQPDPICERRVQAGVGGGNFLNTLMYATGDIRAMDFIDSTVGLGLYALGLWAIGRRWKVPPAAIAFALMRQSYIFDFRRNTIYIADSRAWPRRPQAFGSPRTLMSNASSSSLRVHRHALVPVFRLRPHPRLRLPRAQRIQAPRLSLGPATKRSRPLVARPAETHLSRHLFPNISLPATFSS